jgi:hypothetical protein
VTNQPIRGDYDFLRQNLKIFASGFVMTAVRGSGCHKTAADDSQAQATNIPSDVAASDVGNSPLPAAAVTLSQPSPLSPRLSPVSSVPRPPHGNGLEHSTHRPVGYDHTKVTKKSLLPTDKYKPPSWLTDMSQGNNICDFPLNCKSLQTLLT